MNARNIIIVAALVVVGILVAGYFGIKNCNCDCKGSSDKVKKTDKDGETKHGLVKTVVNLKQEAADREERMNALEGDNKALKKRLKFLEDCLKYTCRKHKTRRRPPHKPTPKPNPGGGGGGGDSHADNDCRVIKVVGHTVYTKGCAGWTPLQFGPKYGERACPGIYTRSLRKRGAYHVFTLSKLRMEQNCRGYQLRKGSKWLTITGGSAMPARRVYAKVLTSGEGYAYYMR